MMLPSVPLRHLSLIRGHTHENQALATACTLATVLDHSHRPRKVVEECGKVTRYKVSQ
jgi:hypothetical protein